MVVPRWQDLPAMAAIALVYALLAKAVLDYFSAAGNVTLVWFPGGMALAILLINGLRLWPGVFAGAVAAGLLVNDSLGLSLTIAVGNTLESVMAAVWLRRNARFSADLERPYDWLCLSKIAAGTALLSAAVGPIAVCAYGFFPLEALPSVVLRWWMADTFGMLTLAPVLLVWRRWSAEWFRKNRVIEALAFIALSLVAASALFLDVFPAPVVRFRDGYWMYVPMMWGALRFGRHGVQWVAALTAVMALMGAAGGQGYFAHDFENTGLWNYWLYQLLLSWIGTFLALALHEVGRVNTALQQSRRSLQAIIDASPAAYVLSDEAGKVNWLNPAFSRYFGYDAADLSSLDDWRQLAFSAAGSESRMQGIWQECPSPANRTQHSPLLELDVRCKSGEIKHVLLGLSRLEDGHCLMSLQDMTAQKEAAKALSDTNVLLQSILETLPIRVFWKDRQSRYLGGNRLFAQDAGVDSVAGLLGKTDYQLAWWEQAATLQQEDLWLMQTGANRVGSEETLRMANGEEVWVRKSKLPLRNSEQEVVGVLGLYEDVSMRKRMDDQLMARALLLEALFESCSVGLLVVDANGRKILQNHALVSLWGIPPEVADNPNDAAQVDFVRQRLHDPERFLALVNEIYAQPEVSRHDEVVFNDGAVLLRYTAPIRDRLGRYCGRLWEFRRKE